MKDIKYIEQMYAIVFLCLGCVFIFLGFIGYQGILKPTAHSMIKDSAIINMISYVEGIICLIIMLIFKIFAIKKSKSHKELLLNGFKLTGIVEKVYIQNYTKYAGHSPFRIIYRYVYEGKEYHRKSYFLWEKPKLEKGDSIEVYVNDSGQSTVQI